MSEGSVFRSNIFERVYRRLHPDKDLGAFPDKAKAAVQKIAISDNPLSATNGAANTTAKAESLIKAATEGGLAQVNNGQEHEV